MNTPVVCNYAAIQFLPYRDTGEFVNVGVVLICPETGFFGARLENRTQNRVTAFFPEVDGELFLQRRDSFDAELKRVQELLTHGGPLREDQAKLAVFRELVKPRESLFRFGPIATVLADDPAAKLEHLFNRVVNRQFAEKVESLSA